MPDLIAEALGIQDISKVIKEEPKQELQVIEVQETTSESSLDSDYEIARESVKRALDKASDALDEMLSIAKQSEHPRAFEVAATLIKTISDTSTTLLNLSKQKQDIIVPVEQQPHTIQNTLIVSTEEMLSRVLEAKKKAGLESF